MGDGRIELIESAYRLELKLEDLLGGLLDCLGRHFEARRPLMGMASELQSDGTIRYAATATRRGNGEAFMAVMESTRQRATDYDHHRMFYGEPGRYSLSTLVSSELHDVAASGGVAELVGLNCSIGDGRALVIGAVRSEHYRPPHGERVFWQPVARHISAAMRVRRSIESALPEAVFRGDGRVSDATGDVRTASLRDRLRHAMLARERRRSRRSRDGEPFWPELVSGRWTLLDRFESDGRRHVIAVRNERSSMHLRALSAREQMVISRITRGDANKVIALELHLSEATVSRTAARAMAKLGLNLATMAQFAASTLASRRIGASELAVASVPAATREAIAGFDKLTTAEREVIVLALRGKSNFEIAASRGRSVRTVVNQLSTAYEKLGVQSRRELVLRCAPTREAIE